MTAPVRFPYVQTNPQLGAAGAFPFLPLALSHGGRSVTVSGLLDTGAAVNVLPHSLGLQLALAWDHQTVPVRLTGNLAALPACGVVLSATVGVFPPIWLTFAWTQSDAVPVILGQMNFFLEFEACFFRARSAFEIKPK
jgi:hypothetical protein